MSARRRRKIGGVVVTCAIDPDDSDARQQRVRDAIVRVLGQSWSLCLDDDDDRRVLEQRLRFALGVDT